MTAEAATTQAPASQTPATVAASRPSVVVLPTGEHLSLQWSDGTPRVSELPGVPSPLSVTTVGDDVYAVPFEAAPYVGSALDRSLFDVTKLATEEGPDGAGQIPVSLAFAGAAVNVPGVRVTSQSGPQATGYLTSQSAPSFGAALLSRLRSNPAGARKAGTPVAGLTQLTLDAPSNTVVQPDFPQVTLTVMVTPPTGRTMLGASVELINTDDSRKYTNFIGIGSANYAKVSVPKGDYDLVGAIFTAAADGTAGPFLVPIVVDYAVTANNQSVTLDAGKATATTSFSTPHPAGVDDVATAVVPGDGTRPSPGGETFSYPAENQLFVQPTPEPKHGVLEFDTYEHRTGTLAGGSAVNYDLTAQWLAGIPANLHRTVQPGQLARVNDRIYASGATGDLAFGRAAVYPDLTPGALFFNPVPKASTLIDYVYGPSDVKWTALLFQSATSAGTASQFMQSVPVSYSPGGVYPVNWFQGSLAPGFSSDLTFPQLYCVACRTSSGMALSSSSELDGDPTHSGSVGGSVSGYERFQVLQDGVSIADVADSDGATFPVPAAPHTYRIEDTIDRAKLGFTSSTGLSSVYTVRTSSTSGSPVPAGWGCAASTTDPCTVLPLLTVSAPLPTTLADTIAPGQSSFVVTVGHVPSAVQSPISTLTFATSLDGKTFAPANVVNLGGGRFGVTLTTPPSAAGHRVSIRIHAEDAAGATLTQTVTDAYTVLGSPS